MCRSGQPRTGRPIPRSAKRCIWIISGGETDPTVTDDDFSAGSDDFIDGLIEADTQVYLEIGTHDEIPYPNKIAYARKLDTYTNGAGVGVDFLADINARAGHGARSHTESPPFDTQATDLLWDALLTVIEPGATPEPLLPATGFRYFKVNPGNLTEKELIDVDAGEAFLPFVFEAPRVAHPNRPFDMVVTGEPGTDYDIEIVPEGGGAPLFTASGQIVSDVLEPWNISNVVSMDPVGLTPGTYEYKVEITKNGGIPIELEFTPSIGADDPALLTVTQFPITHTAQQIWSGIFATIPSYQDQVCWGLSEY